MYKDAIAYMQMELDEIKKAEAGKDQQAIEGEKAEDAPKADQ